jgi:hypothetical protein
MLEHYFCLVEFKSVFEFICLTSFEKNGKTISFPHPSLSLLLAQLEHRSPYRPNSWPALPPSSCSRCQVGPGHHPLPQAAPELDSESDRATPHPALPPLGPHT